MTLSCARVPRGRPRGITVAAAAAAMLVVPALLTTKASPVPARARLAEAYGQVPLAFEANLGQTESPVAFLARGAGYALFLTPVEAVLSLSQNPPNETPSGSKEGQASEDRPPAVLRLTFPGANSSPRVSGLDPQSGRSNYFVGNHRSRWQTDVPHFGRVHYEDVYPGIDLVYYGRQRQLEFDFVVQAGADPRQIGMEFGGADGIETDVRGDLIVHIGGGRLRQHKPVVYQEWEGERHSVAAAYVVEGVRRVAFRLGAYDASRPLVIDPVLAYSSYLGGSDHDFGYGIAVDSSGNAYVTGDTSSTSFPTQDALQRTHGGGYRDVFVAKLNPAGTALLYSTYLGGEGYDYGRGIAVDGSGNAYVTGYTFSPDFPTAEPFRGALAGAADVFVAKLNANGSALMYATYLGGDSGDFGLGIALDDSGSAHLTGFTYSTDFPTASAIQGANAGGYDAFAVKLNPAGTALEYSTYFGGSGDDFGYSLAVDDSGNAYLAGYTESTDFPTASPLQSANAGNADVFVAKLNAAGSAFVYSTYFGGSNGDWGQGVAVDGSGSAYLTGYTWSSDLPTAGPIQGVHAGGGYDSFVTKLNVAGSALVYSTFLGGSGHDYGRAIAVDGSGNVYVTGHTSSVDFPTEDPLQGAFAGYCDGFVVKLDAVGSALVYSTYLGGRGGDYGLGVAVSGLGTAFVAGGTASMDFVTASAIQPANAGSDDVFVAKLVEADAIFQDGFEASP